MTWHQVAVAREAVEIADSVLAGAYLTEQQQRAAVILFRAVLRYAAEENSDITVVAEIQPIIDALGYLTGTFREIADGGVS